ncbi:positive regulator of sigma(e) rsec/mucc [Lucifera butyrica]|uniref:Positive regulator of sigma(E) rsec/mucc n=1 Tax=Lucifera butyrica TaxID=1351585 RepID=A0A498RA82_9FIRM|nr:SoxR reducing system RseC family protein [Lucifera butyrica]VBB07850.1 positive regulator of sigma(e) rsec/mucc [Lucifera butyrica]
MEKQQEGVVIDIIGNLAKVKTSRHNDCENCGACPGNSAIVLEARNPLGATPGQRVLVEVPAGNMLKAAFIVYVLPLLAILAGALAGGFTAGKLGSGPFWFQIAGGGIFFCCSVLYIKYFDHSARSNAAMQPVVTKILD